MNILEPNKVIDQKSRKLQLENLVAESDLGKATYPG